jgi:type IV secretion system protein TrbC
MNKPFLSLRDSTQIVFTTLVSVSAPLLATSSAHAAGSNMPWEQPLQQVLQSVEGPVAKIIAVIIIITTGLTLAFGAGSSKSFSACRSLSPLRAFS